MQETQHTQQKSMAHKQRGYKSIYRRLTETRNK